MSVRQYEQVLVKASHTIVARTNGTVNGTTIDRQQTSPKDNQFNSVMFVVQTGVLTDGVHTFSVEHSDDGTSFSAASDTHGTVPVTAATDDNVVYEFGYHGNKRYVRLVCVTSGATTGGIFGALAVLGNPRKLSTR